MLKFLTKIVFIIAAYFVAIKMLVWVIFTLVIFDLVTGIWKTVRKDGWKALNSKGYKRTIIKLAAYMMALVSTFLIEAEILGTGIFLCKIVSGMISLVEIASIFENLTEITGQPLFMKIYDLLKTKLNTNKDIINSFDGTNKDNEQNTSDNGTNIQK